MQDEDVVREFHRVVGCGTVCGPYEYRSGNKYWYWRADDSYAKQVLMDFAHFLSERRLVQAINACAAI